MAVGTVRIDLHVVAGADAVWNVIGDFAAGPLRLAPGRVTGCEFRGDTRTVTLADGTVALGRLLLRGAVQLLEQVGRESGLSRSTTSAADGAERSP
jgi:hypothetical protein